MGIDLIRGGRIANRGFRKTKSSNNYLKSLINVPLIPFSFTHSSAEEPMPSSTKSFTSVLTSPDSLDSPSLFRASSDTFPMTATPSTKITSSKES